jgi:hypothetical protein
LISVPVPRGPADMTKEPVLVKLEGGRRTQLADVPPPAAAERLSPPEAPKQAHGSSGDALSQLQRLADPSSSVFEGGTPFGLDGPGGLPEEKVPEPGPRDEVTYQTRVSPFVNNNISASITASISADRRYVRLNLAPTFNVVTGTHLQGPVLRNPIIPGFPVP